MRQKKIRFQLCAVLCAILGWWGMLYPELTLTPDTFQIVCEDGSQPDIGEGQKYFEDFLYLKLLGTNHRNIRFRSRLLTELQRLLSPAEKRM